MLSSTKGFESSIKSLWLWGIVATSAISVLTFSIVDFWSTSAVCYRCGEAFATQINTWFLTITFYSSYFTAVDEIFTVFSTIIQTIYGNHEQWKSFSKLFFMEPRSLVFICLTELVPHCGQALVTTEVFLLRSDYILVI